MIDLDDLQSARDRERQTDKLQQLREGFYAEAGEFVRQLRRERERAADQASDPFDSPEVNRLTDEINTAEQTVEALFERRIGKIVKAASLAAADQPASADGMTAEEQALFDELVGDIERARDRVYATLDGDNAADGDADPAGTDATAEPPASDPAPTGDQAADSATEGVSAADLMGTDGEDRHPGGTGDPAPPEEPTDPAREPEGATPNSDTGTDDAGREAGPGKVGPDAPGTPSEDGAGADPTTDGADQVDRTTVRVTETVGPILGVDDREYDLAAEDVVRLPEANADPLVERGAAERLD